LTRRWLNLCAIPEGIVEMVIRPLRRRVAWLVGMTLAICCSGCGPDGPQRFHVSGHVTFGGKPVPAGTIIFEPDDSKKNEGPQGMAPITDGRFDTAREGKATVGGPHRVTILGCDGVNVSEVSPQGRPLFEPYLTTADLPKKQSQVDFDVPAKGISSAAR